MNRLLLLSLALVLLTRFDVDGQTPEKHRVIILTDIEADPDDTQSLIRLLLYANLIDIKGIIATTSVHQKNRIAPESITKVIDAYGKVRSNLEKHEKGYPTTDALLAIVAQGLPVYGMLGVGDGKDSPGSEWIIKILDDKDERPLWVSVWGGANTLAQALFKISKTKSRSDTKRMISKLRVYTISDQDDSGIWIRKNYPDLSYIVSPGGYGNASWIGMNNVVPGLNNETISNAWLSKNVQQAHGPLGSLYPDVAYGMEGDTPAFLSLIPNGLNFPEHPDWGGWGGRYEYYTPEHTSLDLKGFNGGIPIEPEPHPIWTNARDRYSPHIANEYGRTVKLDTASFYDNRVTIWRWRDDVQNDFAARMDWCLKNFSEVNHPPVPALSQTDRLNVKSGERFALDASGSTDPDGDNLSFLWFHYPEAGSWKNAIPLGTAQNLSRIEVVAPQVEKTETAHFILRLTDKGSPNLSRYKRVIVTVLPSK